MSDFIVKDSGQRQEFSGGMVRDVADNKTWWSLVYDGPMLKRWATHLTKGAKKYAVRNWMKAEGQAELDRARDSACRHFAQWMAGDVDEDHAAAVYFNINLAEYVKGKMEQAPQRGPAPFPMTEADKAESERLKPGGWISVSDIRGRFVKKANGDVHWVSYGTIMDPGDEELGDDLRRWDRP